MDVIGPTDQALKAHGSVITIGVYDGVHLGHRRTLAAVVEAARSAGRTSVVATFDRHPAEVVRPEHAPLLLSDLEQRLEILEEVGIDVAAVIPFDSARATESAEEFVADVLVGQLGAAHVIVGEDFRFGRDRLGDVALLHSEGERLGFSVDGVVLGTSDSAPISSTRIRKLLTEGDVEGAAALLGRLHEIRGEVGHGDGRGGPELGFPTVNVHTPVEMAVPAVGIYAGWYSEEGMDPWPAAISVGRRPTFYESAEPLIEAHLVDFEGDLYSHRAHISFLAHLRDEVRFDSVEDLVAQMKADVARTAEICATGARPRA